MDVIRKFEHDTEIALTKLCGNMRGKKILVALSGGADSVCLLMVLSALAPKHGYKLFALHVNHMIRGAEADRDEAFCRGLCKDMDVKLKVVRADIPALAKEHGQSIELCAREYRYKAFAECCDKNKITYTATAHNANDNAETVLYNILRGSGMDGLCGIPQMRDNIIRPILGKTREDILAYLSAKNASYVVDSTNNENDYTRNYIRNVLLPAATRINSDVINSLNRLSATATHDKEYFDSVLDEVVAPKPPRLCGLPKALRGRAVRRIYMEECKALPESKHIQAICNSLENGGEKYIRLPNGINAITCNGTLRFAAADAEVPKVGVFYIREGVNRTANGTVKVELGYGYARKCLEFEEQMQRIFSVSLERTKIKGRLYVRPRQTGDSFVVRNINRNIKKCFIDKKVPASIRDSVPIICDDEGIVYVPYIGAADRVFAKKSKDACNITVAIGERLENEDEERFKNIFDL